MKHKIIQIMAVAVWGLCFFALPVQGKYGGGSGTANDPYLIHDANQMNAIGADANDRSKQFKLMADIDLSSFKGTSFNIIGTSWHSAFTGIFDGNGHTISNFSYTSTATDHIGLFGYVKEDNAEIRNLGLIDPNVDTGTGKYVGSLVGWLEYGTIINCYVEGGSIAGRRRLGGLVGLNYDGTIINCHSSGSVESDFSAGGLVGNNSGGTITNCYSGGNVSGNEYIGGLVGVNGNYGTMTNCYSTGGVSGENNVGGLVGYNNDGTITYCHLTGSVSGTENVGGLVGQNDGTITNCYLKGDVLGGNKVGGIVGHNYTGTITNCYSYGSISGISSEGDASGGNKVGGLLGYNHSGKINNCYSTGEISGVSSVGGLVGLHFFGKITNCYSTGGISGVSSVGGLVGDNSYGTITYCYSAGSIVGDVNVGGLVGDNGSGTVYNSFWDIRSSRQATSDGGIGLRTSEMKTMSTFTDAGWDFVGETTNGTDDIWFIYEGASYPRLWLELVTLLDAEVRIAPSTLNLTGKGRWITVFLWLPEEHNVADIDGNSILLENEIDPEKFQVNEEKQVAIAEYDRQEVQGLFNIGEVEVAITGCLTDELIFKGTDTIKIIDNSTKHEPKDPNSKHEKKDRSLVAHWKFDDGSGSIAIDSAGTNDGDLNGDPTWTAGIIDGALSFDGDGDYVAVASIYALEGDCFTAQAWIRVSESAGLWNPILTQHDLTNDGCYFYVVNGRPSFYVVDGADFEQAISPETLTANQWYHVAVTNDGSNLNLYTNGLLKGTASSNGLTGAKYNAYIGCEISNSLYYNGLIDDVRIYDRALTADEVYVLAY